MGFRNYQAKDVDSYIENAALETRPKLKEIRELIRSTIPDAEEGISWGVPFYKYHGVLAGFAPMKNHVSFGLVTVLENSDRETLEKQGYTTGKKTIQIKFGQKVPIVAIKQILKSQAKMNETRKMK